MINMMIYMVKVAVYLAVFYLIYLVLLKKDTMHGRNRAFLLLSILISVFLPSITVSTSKSLDIQVVGKFLSEVFVTGDILKSEASKIRNPAHFIYSVYITGVILFLFKLLVDFSTLCFLIIRKKKSGGRIIRFHTFDTAAFTAMGFIFINSRLTPAEEADVIKHEQNHLKQNHYIDILIFEFFTAFQWFNPVIHLLNRELRAVHEFQADHECLNSGIPVTSYQHLLLSQIFRSGTLKLTNCFACPSLIRKRMIMMARTPSPKLTNYKLLSALPITLLAFYSMSVTPPPPPSANVETTENEGNGLPMIVADEMPAYPGGDKALLRFVTENLVYPEEARRNQIEGRVIVRFCVTPEGGISQVSVLKSLDPALDAEAIRLVNSLPSFKPGRHQGKPVTVMYLVPITFTLD